MRFLALLRLSSALHNPVLVPVPIPILAPVPISATALVSVPAPFPFPSCVHPRVSTLVLVHVPAPSLLSSPFPSCVPWFSSATVLVPAPSPSLLPFTSPFPTPFRLRFRPRLRSRPRPRSLLPVSRTRLPPWCDAHVQNPDLANGAAVCSRAPPPVCRDGDASGMKVLVVKQKRNAAEDVLLPFPPPNAGTRFL